MFASSSLASTVTHGFAVWFVIRKWGLGQPTNSAYHRWVFRALGGVGAGWDSGAILGDKKYRGGTGLLGAGVAVEEFSLGRVKSKSL